MSTTLRDSEEALALLERADLTKNRLSLLGAAVQITWTDDDGAHSDSVTRINSVSVARESEELALELTVDASPFATIYFSEKTEWEIRVFEKTVFSDVQVRLLEENAGGL